MGHISIFLVAALLLLYWIPGDARSCSCPSGTGCPQSPSRGQCQRRVTRGVSGGYWQTFYVYVSTRNSYKCSWKWGKRCYRSASKRESRRRWVPRTTYRSECQPYCCSGYSGTAPNCRPYCPCYNGGSCIAPRMCRCASGWTGTNCQTPICTNGCNHGGTCIAPDKCRCASGVTGPHCAPRCNPDCSTGGTCTATDTCTCAPGWIGRRCELDIDECYTNTSNCQQNCNNTIGSFNCSCKEGYKTSQENVSQCEDIDECESNPCEHFCNNTEGSYKCSCKKDYILIEDMNCTVPVLPEELTTAGAVGGLLGLLVILGVAAAAVIITLAFIIIRYKKRKCKDIPDEKQETVEKKFVGDKVVYGSPEDYPEVLISQSPAYSSLQQGKEEQKEEVRYDTQVVPKKKSSAPAYETVLYK